MFLFFNNRMGCVGSIAVSIILTLVIVALTRSCNHV